MATGKIEAEQKKRILRASFYLFVANGYSKTSTRDIADRVGIKRGLLYYYYPKKEYLLNDMYDDFTECFMKYLQERHSKSPLDNTYIYVKTVVLLKVFLEHFGMTDLELINSVVLRGKLIDSIVSLIAKYEGTDEGNPGASKRVYEMLVAHTAAVGATISIISSKVEGTINITYQEIAVIASEIVYSMIKTPTEEITLNTRQALIEMVEFDVYEFMSYFDAHCEWFDEALSKLVKASQDE